MVQVNEQHLASLSDEGRYRILVDAITDYAVYMLDSEGQISSWNAGAQRFKGYRADEVMGRHFSIFYTDEDRRAGAPERALETAAKEGRFEAEGWRVRKDGTTFWTHIIIDPIRDNAGRVIGYAKVTRDLTERKKAELQMEQAREALFQTQKMEAIGQLTGGVAHDFNNLLMVILTSLNLLQKRVGHDPKARSLIENAKKGAERGATLTSRMLAFARRQEFAAKPADLRQVAYDIGALLQRSLDPSIDLDFRFSPELPLVLTDQNQLETALLNLVVNARDALPYGGTILIAAEEKDFCSDETGLLEGRYVCLSITDDGEGMDAETTSRATEPFFTTKGVGKGTGLGLSMVQGLVQQWGGTIRIRSAKGEGTTVELWLKVASDEDEVAAEEPEGSPQLATKETRYLTVLAVDDDPLVLMGTAAMLEDLGHSCLEANSGAKALAMLKEHDQVDVLITDQAMPNMTGLELIEAVRRERPNLPVILASGYVEIENASTLPIPRLSKPFTEEQLESVLNDIM